jgi:hypothetical protein
MAPSIPKLFAALVVNRYNSGLAAVDEWQKVEQSLAQGTESVEGRISLEHWMNFCRETDAFSKLRVAPSDCIASFRRGVQAAASDDSALARKVGLVMNLEAFCGCVVALADLAGALPGSTSRSRRDDVLHAVWDCDSEISKSCSLLLLRLLTATPDPTPSKAVPLLSGSPLEPNSSIARGAGAADSCPAFGSSPRMMAYAHSARSHKQDLLPHLSDFPRKSYRLQSIKKFSPAAVHPPSSSTLPSALNEDPARSVASSTSKFYSISTKSSALSASPPSSHQHRRTRPRRPEGFAPTSSRRIVDIATGSEFLKWFEGKLAQVGSDGVAYPVRVVAVQVRFTHSISPTTMPASLPPQLLLTHPAVESLGETKGASRKSRSANWRK